MGDPVTLELGYRPLLGKLASAPGMDDKTGLWVAIEALRRTKGKKLNCSLYAVSTVQEEIGLRGAMTSTHSIEPHVGIAIDVTHATDCPTIDKKQEGDIALGKGPVIYRGPNMNPRVVTELFAAAKDKEIPYQVAANGTGHRHRRQHDPDQPRRRGGGPDQHSQPLHAQSGGSHFAGRSRPCRRPAGRIRPGAGRRRRFSAVRRRRRSRGRHLPAAVGCGLMPVAARAGVCGVPEARRIAVAPRDPKAHGRFSVAVKMGKIASCSVGAKVRRC